MRMLKNMMWMVSGVAAGTMIGVYSKNVRKFMKNNVMNMDNMNKKIKNN